VRVEILKLVKSATASISVSWSNITGSISDNADLQDALDSKADAADLDSKADKSQLPIEGTTDHFVAISGVDGSMADSGYKASDFVQQEDLLLKGIATPSINPILVGNVRYIVLAPATLPNFKDREGAAITVTQDDLDAGDVFLIGTDGVFDMQVDATREYVDQKVSGIDYTTIASNSGIVLSNGSFIVKSNAGTFGAIGYSVNAGVSSEFKLVQRSTAGAIVTSPPTDPTHATPKSYVDAATKSKAQLLALTPLEDPQTPKGVLLNQLIAALKA